jgi:hypothetical protein
MYNYACCTFSVCAVYNYMCCRFPVYLVYNYVLYIFCLCIVQLCVLCIFYLYSVHVRFLYFSLCRLAQPWDSVIRAETCSCNQVFSINCIGSVFIAFPALPPKLAFGRWRSCVLVGRLWVEISEGPESAALSGFFVVFLGSYRQISE